MTAQDELAALRTKIRNKADEYDQQATKYAENAKYWGDGMAGEAMAYHNVSRELRALLEE